MRKVYIVCSKYKQYPREILILAVFRNKKKALDHCRFMDSVSSDFFHFIKEELFL